MVYCRRRSSTSYRQRPVSITGSANYQFCNCLPTALLFMPKSSRSSYKAIQVLLVALVPTVVRGVFLNINRVHGDEYILAYFASKYELLKTNVFAPVPADPAAWVSQQASVFTILQKIYLLFVGESFWAVKFSTIPYLLITAIGFYLLARLVLEKKSALIAG